MKCSIVSRTDPDFLILRLKAETLEEEDDVSELKNLCRSDKRSPIASCGGGMVEVKVPRIMPE